MNMEALLPGKESIRFSKKRVQKKKFLFTNCIFKINWCKISPDISNPLAYIALCTSVQIKDLCVPISPNHTNAEIWDYDEPPRR
jgi:hypothetical protein